MADRYWVGGSGTWNATNTTNWSTTSGGTGGASVPTLADDVYFDSNSNSTGYSVSTTGNIDCRSLSLSNPATGQLSFTKSGLFAINIYGNFYIAPNVITSFGGNTYLLGSGNFTVSTNATPSIQNIYFDNAASKWTLGSDFRCSALIVLISGEFDASSYNVTCGLFESSGYYGLGTRTLRMGSGLWTLTAGGGIPIWRVSEENFTFFKDTANIRLFSTTGVFRRFAGLSFHYNKIIIGDEATTIIDTGSTFQEISSTTANAFTLQVGTITVGKWSVTGSPGKPVTISYAYTNLNNVYPYSTIFLNGESTSNVDNLFFQYAQVIRGPSQFFAGPNSTDWRDFLNIGSSSSYQPSFFSGRLSNVRIVKGRAVYTSNFTPPTGTLPAIANTQLLTLQSPTIVDNSNNAFSIVNNNSVTMSSGLGNPVDWYGNFNPTPITSSFPVLPQSLSIAKNSAFEIGTGDFTVEFYLWINNPSGFDQGKAIISLFGGDIGQSGVPSQLNSSLANAAKLFEIYIKTDGFSNFHSVIVNTKGLPPFNSTETYTFPTSIFSQTWAHIAVVRLNGVITVYKDGVSVGSASLPGEISTAFTDNNTIRSFPPSPRTLYWVGGSGNWSNTAKWSTTSGGPGGAGVPTSFDNAIFDTSSNTGTYTVTIAKPGDGGANDPSLNVTHAYVNNLTMSGPASGTLNFVGPQNNYINLIQLPPAYSPLGGSFNIHGNVNISQTGVSIDDGLGGNPPLGYINLTGSTTPKTLTTNNNLVPGSIYWNYGAPNINFVVNGVGVDWSLGSNINARQISVRLGSFKTNNYTANLGSLVVDSNSSTSPFFLPLLYPVLDLGNSTVNCWRLALTSNEKFIFNANTSQINVTGPSSFVSYATQESRPVNTSIDGGSGKTFYNVRIVGKIPVANNALDYDPSTVSGDNTYNNFVIGEPEDLSVTLPSNRFILYGNQTVNGNFICSGNTRLSNATYTTNNRSGYFVYSDNTGVRRTITANTAIINDCDFRDIQISGAAAGVSAVRSGDCGGNIGITFPAPKTVYAVSGGSKWNDIVWSTSSGGVVNANNFPLAQDTAIIDNSSAISTIALNHGTIISNLNTSSRTTPFSINLDGVNSSSRVNFYGNVTTGSATSWIGYTNSPTTPRTGISSIFMGRSKTQTINVSNNQTSLQSTFVIETSNGAVQLANNISVNAPIIHTIGAFNANSYNVNTTAYSSTIPNNRILNMGSGTWSLSGTGSIWDINLTGMTFSSNTSTISLTNNTTASRTFAGNGLTYYNLNIGGVSSISNTIITGTNIFNQISSNKLTSHFIQFGGNQTMNTWSISGTSGNVVTVLSNTTGISRILTINNRTNNIDYLNVSNITSNKSPVTFFVGANSKLFNNVFGVAAIPALPAPETLYILDSGTSWTVPSDWNSNNNLINLFSGGGGGAGGQASGNNRAGGGGGGGGGFTRIPNLFLTPSSNVSYTIGAGGVFGTAGGNGGNGGATTFNSGAYTTTGGGGGQATTGPTSTGGSAGTGNSQNGGVGGAGSISTTTNTSAGGGGGGGAGGPNGSGRNGGNGFATVGASTVGGGGGGNGGGSSGGNASAATEGSGGNNFGGSGGGTSWAIDSFNGGGGSGGKVGFTGRAGSPGIDVFGIGGAGGFGGAGDTNSTQTNTALYGSGGGGGGVSTGGTTYSGSSGSQGGIIIWYSTLSGGNMLMMFK